MAEEQGKGMIQAMEKEMLYLQQFHLTQVYSENSSQLASLRSELGEQEAALIPEDVKLDQWKNRLRESKDNAHGCTADEPTDPPVAKKPPPGYAAKFETIEAKTLEQLEAHLEHLDSELRSEQKTMRDQAKVQQRYDELEKGLESVEAEVESLAASRGEKVTERETISTTGVRKVQELINKVSAKFGDYFAELGYSGEVTLSRAHEMDFKSYGVAIKVRFRAGEEWSELAKGRQSGGEMSVTTAVYMLALQELTTVPFRCVDEINQGLDERNERRVWSMILAAATEGGGSQYFYLAPKMPYGLEYKPGTVVHICQASSSLPSSISSVPEDPQNQESRWVAAAKKLKLAKKSC